MKNLFNHKAFASPAQSELNYFLSRGYESTSVNYPKEGLLNPGIAYQMGTGQIPELRDVCLALANTFTNTNAPYSAMQFVPVLQGLQTLEPDQAKRFMKNPETRQVLVSNNLFEVVLIHWKPGKAGDIHGHPGEGCVFKLLQGKLEELRYTPEKSPRLLSMNSLRKGSVAYIDDSIAYHQVGNPYGSSAISLHAYIK